MSTDRSVHEMWAKIVLVVAVGVLATFAHVKFDDTIGYMGIVAVLLFVFF